jgi:hypothetical protein
MSSSIPVRDHYGEMATTAPLGPRESFFRTGAAPPESSHIGDGCRRANTRPSCRSGMSAWL